jgi:hypothetical protein
VGDLADVQQAILAGQQVDQGAEVQDLGDRAFVDLADLDLGRDLLDAALGFVGLGGVAGAMVMVPSSSMLIWQPVSPSVRGWWRRPCRSRRGSSRG